MPKIGAPHTHGAIAPSLVAFTASVGEWRARQTRGTADTA